MGSEEEVRPPEAEVAPKAPEEPPEAPAEEHRVAGTPHAVAANAAVLGLTRAARSFTLYDPSNKVVRALIADYRERFRQVLDGFGPLALEVHPFELCLGREVVYLERDRERSLAFRLFRDGVRRLAFGAETTWEELLRLLQILSIRYTGVRQQEDDLVTLLRKAGFRQVHVAAIEGFVPEEEDAEPPLGDLLRGTSARYDAPAQWDLPSPEVGEPVPLRHRPVGEEVLARLRAEEDDVTVPAHAVRAVLELLHAPGVSDLPSVLAFALEVREYLLVESRADLVVDLARSVWTALSNARQAGEAFLASYLDTRTLRALVAALPPDAGTGQQAGAQPDSLALDSVSALLDAVPGETLGRLLDLLAEEGAGPRAPLLRRLVARGSRHAPETLATRLNEARGPVAVVLLQLLAEVDPAGALRAASAAATAPEEPLQREALRLLEAAPFGPEIARALHHVMESRFESVRVAALAAMAARGGPRVFPALLAHAEKHAATLTAAEAESTGRALVRASPAKALEAFEAWLRPKGGGLLGRIVKLHAPPSLQRTALAGLLAHGGPESGELLGFLAEKGDPALAPSAAAALDRRGRGGHRA